VVRYGDDYGVDGPEVGYDPDSLGIRWQRTAAGLAADLPDCGDVLCAGRRSALDVLDPATGRAAWRAPEYVDLGEQNGFVLERDAGTGAPLRLADRATGATRADLTGWAAVLTTDDRQPLVLRRGLAAGKSEFGVLLDGSPRRVQRLGASAGPVSDCTADLRYVVCRGNDGLELWAYSS
jgi:hypothetical protein